MENIDATQSKNINAKIGMARMLSKVLILIALSMMVYSRTFALLYDYHFSNVDRTMNEGSVHVEEADLYWTGAIRPASDTGYNSVLNRRETQYYRSNGLIPGLAQTFTQAGGFHVRINVKLTTLHNMHGDFCIFCLMGLGKPYTDANIAFNLDHGIRWQGNRIIFNIRSTDSEMGSHNSFSVKLLPKYINIPLTIEFRYTEGKREAWFNNDLVYAEEAKKLISVPNSVNVWSSAHSLTIGTIRSGSFIRTENADVLIYNAAFGNLLIQQERDNNGGSIQFFYSSSSIKTRTVPQRRGHLVTDSEKGRMPSKVQSEISRFSQSACVPNKCGMCNVADRECDLCRNEIFCVSSIEDGNIYSTNNLTRLLDVSYEIRVLAPSTYTLPEFRCNSVVWKVSEEVQCTNLRKTTYMTSMSLGALYECITGKSRKLINSTNEIAGLSTYIYINGTEREKCHVHFGAGASFVPQSINNATDNVFGISLSSVSVIEENRLSVLHHAKYIHDYDLYFPFTLCLNQRDALTNQSLSLVAVSLYLHSGPSVSLSNVSGCYESGGECCHHLNMHTIQRYLLRTTQFSSESFIRLTVNERDYFMAFNQYIPFAQMAIPPRSSSVPIPPEQTFATELCLYSDAGYQIPLQYTTPGIKIYYRIMTVPHSLRSTFTCPHSFAPVQCFAPGITYMLTTMTLCEYSLPYDKSAIDCGALHGDGNVLVSFTDPYRPHYAMEWQPSPPIMQRNCTSNVQGSFTLIRKRNNLGLFWTGSTVDTSLVHQSYFTDTLQHLARFREDYHHQQQLHWSSSHFLYGCPTTSWVLFDGTCVYFSEYCWQWVTTYWVTIAYFIVFVLMAILIWYYWQYLFMCFQPKPRYVDSPKPEEYTVSPVSVNTAVVHREPTRRRGRKIINV